MRTWGPFGTKVTIEVQSRRQRQTLIRAGGMVYNWLVFFPLQQYHSSDTTRVRQGPDISLFHYHQLDLLGSVLWQSPPLWSQYSFKVSKVFSLSLIWIWSDLLRVLHKASYFICKDPSLLCLCLQFALGNEGSRLYLLGDTHFLRVKVLNCSGIGPANFHSFHNHVTDILLLLCNTHIDMFECLKILKYNS